MTEKRKDIILDTALELFAAHGYDSTSTSQVAKKAGVSEGLIFRHYEKKEKLLERIIEKGMEDVAQSFTAFEKEQDPTKKIRTYIELTFTLLKKNNIFWKLLHQVRSQPVVQKIAGQKIANSTQYILQTLAQQFELLGYKNPAQEALLVFATVDGIALHYTENPKKYPLKEIKSLIIKRYENL